MPFYQLVSFYFKCIFKHCLPWLTFANCEQCIALKYFLSKIQNKLNWTNECWICIPQVSVVSCTLFTLYKCHAIFSSLWLCVHVCSFEVCGDTVDKGVTSLNTDLNTWCREKSQSAHSAKNLKQCYWWKDCLSCL